MSSKRSPAPGVFGAADAGVGDECVERAVDGREHLVAVADVARLRDGARDDVAQPLLVAGEQRQARALGRRAGRAIARPMPVPAPVTTMCLPASRVNALGPRGEQLLLLLAGEAGRRVGRRVAAPRPGERVANRVGERAESSGPRRSRGRRRRSSSRRTRRRGSQSGSSIHGSTSCSSRNSGSTQTSSALELGDVDAGLQDRAERRGRADGVVRAGGASLGRGDDPGGEVAAVDDLRRARRRARGRARRRPRRCATGQ